MLITQGAFMPRPEKCRRIENYPGVTYFKPAGIPIRDLEEISLSPVEIEALRWKEIENLDQEGGAQKMNISRPTFQRILASARYKIADALIKGKAIRIEGGNFEIAARRFVCKNSHEWDVPFQTAIDNPPRECPTCQIPELQPLRPLGEGCAQPAQVRCCGRKIEPSRQNGREECQKTTGYNPKIFV
jgi:predicted DNA-binding protein (UPF0251 family)